MADLIHGLYSEGEKIADTKAPAGPLEGKWEKRKFEAKLVNPANRRKLSVIVVGTGLAGGAAAASLGEMGYNVKAFYYQDSARRAHSIAAQGGINAAKNYQGDGDSVNRLFMDTIKGGDFRSREANVHRLAEVCARALVGKNVPVNLAGREIGEAVEVFVDESLVVSEVEVSLRAVLGHKHFAVLKGAHRAGVNVDIRVKLLRRYLQPARLEQPPKRCRRNALAKPRHNTARYKNILRHTISSVSVLHSFYVYFYKMNRFSEKTESSPITGSEK